MRIPVLRAMRGGCTGAWHASSPCDGDDVGSPAPHTTPTQVVPWDFTLVAVKQWIWKRSDDLVINYSVRGPTTKLKMPSIRPPDDA